MSGWNSSPVYAAILTRVVELRVGPVVCSDRLAGGVPATPDTGWGGYIATWGQRDWEE